ncbi:DUF427 domain-containing protein [Methanococcoides alaskense]|uniref:Uncharacterized protein (DUF427 family) n=1 Tax=Methanococcoides alaskense TaxID=325778 RepID=A0AA90U1Y0_9EURY|nr:DUF427 domain-containing protein [Methanococcoides alaskense]MDA0524177.1 DUF427 domain-containing protein [Methanococcoides alaskense]MDR6223704.1 uncharacterized protein (DUF427 family) [Methanococcoides alaskense]
MATAKWNGVLLAESDSVKVIEGNLYFPPESVNKELFRESDTRYQCPWKGLAYYFDIVVNEEENKDAAWSYLEPKEAAKEIAGHFAFGNGVELIP